MQVNCKYAIHKFTKPQIIQVQSATLISLGQFKVLGFLERPLNNKGGYMGRHKTCFSDPIGSDVSGEKTFYHRCSEYPSLAVITSKKFLLQHSHKFTPFANSCLYLK